MQIDNRLIQILQSLDRPAFYVKDEVIVCTNKEARDYNFTEGTDFLTVLQAPASIYRSNWTSPIELGIQAGGFFFQAHITRVDDMELVILDQRTGMPELKSLHLASVKLRQPLFDLMNAVSTFTEDPQNQDARNMLYKNVYELDRMVVNMDCASRYRENVLHPERTEMRSFLTELLGSVQEKLEACGIAFEYNVLQQPVFCDLDPAMFINALMNMITNGLDAQANRIQVDVSCNESHLRISVIDNGKPVIQEMRFNMFSKFQREPAVSDSYLGLGLGMVIIHAAAIAHKGSLLMDVCNVDETRMTMTLPLAEAETEIKQRKKIFVDKTGGLDPIAVHLSAYLPPEQFKI